jgi:hypothetical protein
MSTTVKKLSENQEHRKTTNTENQAPEAKEPESSDTNTTPESVSSEVEINGIKTLTVETDRQLPLDSQEDAKRSKKRPRKVAKHPDPLSEELQELRTRLNEQVIGADRQKFKGLFDLCNHGGGVLWKGDNKSFPDYAKAQFGFTPRYTKLMLRAEEFNQAVGVLGNNTPTLTRESHIRPIIQLIPKEEEQVVFWAKYCEKNRITSESVVKQKAGKIRNAVKAYLKNKDGGKTSMREENREAETIKAARREGKKLVTRLSNATKDLPNHVQIKAKLEELSNLLKENK